MATATETVSSASGVRREGEQPRVARFPGTRRFSYESKDRLKQLEKGFVSDGVALSHLANNETDRTAPSLNFGIPQYNAMDDRYSRNYFRSRGLPKVIKEVEQESSTLSSMQGNLLDKFIRSSEAKKYLQDRTAMGAGYTRRAYGGHQSVPTALPKVGYHGPEGYRRNTPDLRKQRSVFDYEDPFDNPKPATRRLRTKSAPATLRVMRLKSASVYRSYPSGRRVQSAMPRPPTAAGGRTRELATGPLT